MEIVHGRRECVLLKLDVVIPCVDMRYCILKSLFRHFQAFQNFFVPFPANPRPSHRIPPHHKNRWAACRAALPMSNLHRTYGWFLL